MDLLKLLLVMFIFTEEDPADDEEGDGDGDGEDDQGDEEEVEDGDLEDAWKMLEFARVIHEKHGCCTIETVDIITKLADINCFKGMYLWLGLMFSCSSLACWMTNLIPPVWPPMWLILFPQDSFHVLVKGQCWPIAVANWYLVGLPCVELL